MSFTLSRLNKTEQRFSPFVALAVSVSLSYIQSWWLSSFEETNKRSIAIWKPVSPQSHCGSSFTAEKVPPPCARLPMGPELKRPGLHMLYCATHTALWHIVQSWMPLCVCRAAGRCGGGFTDSERAGYQCVPAVWRLQHPGHQHFVWQDLKGLRWAAAQGPQSQRPHQEHFSVHLHIRHHR